MLVDVSDDNLDWARLASYVNERMIEIPIDQAGLAERADLSVPTVKGFMTGKPRSATAREQSLRKLSVGLGWTPTSAETILVGGEPELAVSIDEVSRLRAEIDSLRSLIDNLNGMVSNLDAGIAAHDLWVDRIQETTRQRLPQIDRHEELIHDHEDRLRALEAPQRNAQSG